MGYNSRMHSQPASPPRPDSPEKREFSAEDIRKLAALARLELTDSEIPAAARALGDIIKLVAQMEKANPGQIQELTHVSAQTRMRDDNATPPPNRDELMANAPQSESGFFLTPKVVE